ncbi:IS1595 family transposase [Parasphingorhabdus sp.]|uniref:IS1595 family transposase n=1 Tax=Parasphingorhabdus sp. TaxID=2709688 RepID=UPI002F93A6B5
MKNKPKAPTLRQFQDRFPTEDSCLEHLMRTRFGDRHDCGKCGKNAHFYRITTRRSYACEYCGHQVYPTADTPFHRTRTSLRDWFYVMFMFCTTRNGVAAKEVERQIGVTYKTAWRMCHEIRKYMAQTDGDDMLGGGGGIVEIDETLIGGSISGKGSGYKANKTCVVGFLERDDKLVTRVVTRRDKAAMHLMINNHVLPGAKISTDEFGGYKDLHHNGYQHMTVRHKAKEYSNPVTGAGVNAIEGFWSALKRGINGTHIHVSGKHLWKYLGEFEYRHNRRHAPHLMLDEMISAFQR